MLGHHNPHAAMPDSLALHFRISPNPLGHVMVKDDLVKTLNPLVRRQFLSTDQHRQEVLMWGNRSRPCAWICPTCSTTRVRLCLTISELLARSLDFDMECNVPAVSAIQDEKNVGFDSRSYAANTS